MKVIILPGFFRSTYSIKIKSLAAELEKAGHNVQIIDFNGNVSIFKGIDEHARYLIKNLETNSDKFVVVAESFSGIILKRLIQIRPDLRKKIIGIVFAAVPHNGTWMAMILCIFPAMRELLPFSKIIKETKKLVLTQKVINFIADFEIKIRPQASGRLDGFPNILIKGTNHDNLIKNEEFIEKTIEFINNL